MAAPRPFLRAVLGPPLHIGPRQPICQIQRQQSRAISQNASKYKRKDNAGGSKKKKKQRADYIMPDLTIAEQFSLCDAMRYIRAFEVGQSATSVKYEVAVRFRTKKSGAAVRNQLRLPHPVDTSTRICVICPPDSKQAQSALEAGAVIVGQDSVLETIKAGNIDFDRCICHPDSLPALNKAALGRVLGPRGLMPSVKLGTVVRDIGKSVRDMMGGSAYRERQGVVRMAIGQLGYTPEEMQRNIKTFMEAIKKDCASVSDRTPKEVHEVVLSSTSSPGFSLNGDFRGPESLPSSALSVQ